MNISHKASKLIRKYETHYNKENIFNNKYLILKRECKGAGFGIFAYYIAFIAEIDYAIKQGMIPVIDMQNYKSSLMDDDKIGKKNPWEDFFEQPYGIGVEEALSSRNSRYFWADVPSFHPNESLDCLYNEPLMKHYNEIAKKYLCFRPNVKEALERAYRNIIGTKRVLGVLARGTDYADLKPYNHPVQPTVDEMIPVVERYKSKYNCDYVYLATEDEGILVKFKEKYGDKLLCVNQKRVSNVKSYLYEDQDFTSVDKYTQVLSYLESIYVLSKCVGLVAGRCSGTVGACILTDGYEFLYVFTKGRYGIEDEIV